jgi:hypothetical protein
MMHQQSRNRDRTHEKVVHYPHAYLLFAMVLDFARNWQTITSADHPQNHRACRHHEIPLYA